jgi:IS5 family transposase
MAPPCAHHVPTMPPELSARQSRRATNRCPRKRTTRHEGYRISQRKRKRIEECFGWLKTIALLRKVRHRGLDKVDWVFAFACAAYNLVRLRNLSIHPA